MKINALLLGLTLLAFPHLAEAQPDTNNTPKAENPPNRPVGGRGNRGGRNLTPEQIQQMQTQMQARRDENIRRQLTQAGFTDTGVQDAIVAFANGQDTAGQSLQEKWRLINQAVRGETVTEPQLMSLLNSFRAQIDEEKARRAKATAALDAKISFSKKPRLDALLMTMGLTGEEAAFVNNSGVSRNAFGGGRGGLGGPLGRGGQGGAFGGGFGGLNGGFNF